MAKKRDEFSSVKARAGAAVDPHERVLAAMHAHPEASYGTTRHYFRSLKERTGLPHAEFERAARTLERRGLAQMVKVDDPTEVSSKQHPKSKPRDRAPVKGREFSSVPRSRAEQTSAEQAEIDSTRRELRDRYAARQEAQQKTGPDASASPDSKRMLEGHKAVTDAESTHDHARLAEDHGRELQELAKTHGELEKHHRTVARSSTDVAVKHAHQRLAEHHGEMRERVGKLSTTAALASEHGEGEHAAASAAHSWMLRGAGQSEKARALHAKMAEHHENLRAHHVAAKNKVPAHVAKQAIGEARDAVKASKAGGAHTATHVGKRGGLYYTAKSGVKVYVGKAGSGRHRAAPA